MGMKQILAVMVAVVLVVGCGATKLDPNTPANITDPIDEEKIRKKLNKKTGELTNTDLANVTGLYLYGTKITDAVLKEVAKFRNLTNLGFIDTKITDKGVKEVAKMQKLTYLSLRDTQITDANIAKLQKALPNCEIAGP